MTKLTLKTDRQIYKDDKHRIEAYKKLLDNPEGHNFLLDFLSNMGFYSNKTPKDANDAFVQVGKRQACNFLLNFVSIKEVKEG